TRQLVPHRIQMILSGSLTSLAIDSFGKPIGEMGGAFAILGRLVLRISVMAEHAPVCDPAAEAPMAGPVVAGAHGPGAALLRIPGQRKLDQFFRFRPADVASGMITGAKPVIHSRLENVSRFSVESDLMPLEVCAAVPRRH